MLHGFEAGMQTALAILGRARDVAVLAPSDLLEEFLVPTLDAHRSLLRRGGTARVLSLGRPAESVADAAREAGLQVRWLDELREYGIVVSDREVLLFPSVQPAQSALTPCSVHLPDLLATGHFLLAFERAWERSQAL